MTYATTSGPWHYDPDSLTASDSSGNQVWCASHWWYCESLRGTNRNRRVETLRCLVCGEKRRRVWSSLPAQRMPDREYRIGDPHA